MIDLTWKVYAYYDALSGEITAGIYCFLDDHNAIIVNGP